MGSIDAENAPLIILFESKASSVNAFLGILNKLAPLPLNEPVYSFISPKNVEPLSYEVTTNPSSGEVDAVTEPLNIFDVSKSAIAAAGMLNNFSPEPLKAEPDCTLTSPKKVEPLSTEVTTNPSSGDVDAVTEPDAINAESNASSVSAVLGISNNSAPLPLNTEPLLIEIPPSTSIEPVN